jgi:hypothetical protein
MKVKDTTMIKRERLIVLGFDMVFPLSENPGIKGVVCQVSDLPPDVENWKT